MTGSKRTLCAGGGLPMRQRVPKAHGDGFLAACPTCQRSLVPKADGTSRVHSVKGPNTKSSDSLNSYMHNVAITKVARFEEYADTISLGWFRATFQIAIQLAAMAVQAPGLVDQQ